MTRSRLVRPAAAMSERVFWACSLKVGGMSLLWFRLWRAALAPGQHDLAALAGAHEVEALLEVGEREPVRDDGRYVEAALDHRRHLVPGVVHLAPVDSPDGQHVEDHLVPV